MCKTILHHACLLSFVTSYLESVNGVWKLSEQSEKLQRAAKMSRMQSANLNLLGPPLGSSGSLEPILPGQANFEALLAASEDPAHDLKRQKLSQWVHDICSWSLLVSCLLKVSWFINFKRCCVSKADNIPSVLPKFIPLVSRPSVNLVQEIAANLLRFSVYCSCYHNSVCIDWHSVLYQLRWLQGLKPVWPMLASLGFLKVLTHTCYKQCAGNRTHWTFHSNMSCLKNLPWLCQYAFCTAGCCIRICEVGT